MAAKQLLTIRNLSGIYPDCSASCVPPWPVSYAGYLYRPMWTYILFNYEPSGTKRNAHKYSQNRRKQALEPPCGIVSFNLSWCMDRGSPIWNSNGGLAGPRARAWATEEHQGEGQGLGLWPGLELGARLAFLAQKDGPTLVRLLQKQETRICNANITHSPLSETLASDILYIEITSLHANL